MLCVLECNKYSNGYVLFLVKHSLDKWAWLAINIHGKGRIVNASRGADRDQNKKSDPKNQWEVWASIFTLD